MSEPFNSGPEPERDVDADRMVETPESLRDEDSEAMPMDRGLEASDRPLGAEKHGITPAEVREGEPLDSRLAQELPDIGEHDPVDDIVAADPATFGTDPTDAVETDEEVLDDAYGDSADPAYGETDVPVGRLVEPDEGARSDTEKDAVAIDVGYDGGDLSAEEAALHIENDR